MMMCFLVFLISLYIFSVSSFHSLILLLFIEMLILSSVLFSSSSFYSWFSFLMIILVAVCLGAYGVSMLVSNSRSKGGSYFISF